MATKPKSIYSDLPEPLKTYLPDMFASYSKLEWSSPSSWIQWGNGLAKAKFGRVCHADMRYSESGYTDLITAVPETDNISMEYLRMLIRGPFRSVSDLIKLERVGKFYYFHCLELKRWPANVLMNFCIATRVPIEFSYFLKPWAERCEKGFEPVLAFLLTTSYGANSRAEQFKTRNFEVYRSNHLWFDPASKWSNILNGVIEEPSRSYYEYPGDTNPTNSLWGKCDDYKLLMKMSDEEIAEFYTQPVKIHQPPEPPVPFIKYKKLNGVVFPNPAQMGIEDAMQALQAMGEPGFAQVQPAPVHMAIHDEIGIGAANPAGFNLQWAVAPAVPQPEVHFDPLFDDDDDDDEEFHEHGFEDDDD